MEKNSYSLQRNTGLIGRYVIQEVLGQGGFGITYLGIDKLYGNKVAIKEYYPQKIAMRKAQYEDVVTVTSIEEKNNYDKGKKRFLDEAQVMARFNKNEGIVKILDFFEANNTAYIVMEYLEGITLKQYLGKYGVLQFRNLIEMMLPLLEALIEIHSQGLIHRDISPDNIMVQHNGKLKLMDFGAARDYTESGNKSLTVILKPGYAPPEQYQTHGVQGPWTDIYALCATIYKCLTGITPPDAIARVMDDKFKEPDQLDGKLSPDIKKILWKGMNIFPEERYQDIVEFGEDVYDALFTPEENKKLDLDNEKNIDEDLDSPDKDNESVLKDDKIEGAVKKTSIPKKEKRKSPVKKVLVIIVCLLLAGGIKYYSTGNEQEISTAKKDLVENPKIVKDTSVEGGKKVTWDCIWFGSYPQTKIVSSSKENDLYSTLEKSNGWDKNNDIIIGKEKYHRAKKCYFKYEPIKWRVIKCENGEALLLSDIVLDKQKYNKRLKKVTWEKSTLRKWLNKKFMNRAFSSSEQEAIRTTKVINEDNYYYKTDGGNDTLDKIYLLSLSETDEEKEYGFTDSYGMTIKYSNYADLDDYQYWWLRTPGEKNISAAAVDMFGEAYVGGGESDMELGIRPVLHLNLLATDDYSYAGKIASDGTVNQVDK
ncbi:protein kinase domain-containing protein [Anaerobutyricum hallii]|jgi:serine/threonine protein kinase|uniref:protein kinase domain-containing protein n=1 Tax=Anaerobutyricum hallii TaxID=39488 RepID=UPI003AB48882